MANKFFKYVYDMSAIVAVGVYEYKSGHRDLLKNAINSLE